MNQKHSPGPWTVNEAWGYIEICGTDGNVINDPELTPSDAALIAAAPEMLEVLNGLAALGNDIAPYWENRIKSVIAKAEGNVFTETPTE